MGKNKAKKSDADKSFLVNNVFIKPEKENELEHLESSVEALIALFPEDHDVKYYIEQGLRQSEEIDDNPNGPHYGLLNDPQYPKKTFHYMTYSINPFLNLIFLVKTVNDDFAILSISLSGKGCKNNFQITSKYQWENTYEGDVSAQYCEKEFCFIEPFFFKNRKKLKLNKPSDISLFGVALSCEPQEGSTLEINEGALFEHIQKEFLEKNPDKTAADMMPISISTQGMTYFEEEEFKTVYDYRGMLISVDQDEVFGEKCFKLSVVIYKTPNEQEFVAINLYASEHVLEGYIPKEGDDITGRLILFGTHFDHNSEIGVISYR